MPGFIERSIRKGADLCYFGDKGKVSFGLFHSTDAGYGMKLSSSRNLLERLHADDGGIALSSGYVYGPGEDRMLLTYAQTSGKTVFGRMGHVKVGKAVSIAADWTSGLWGYLEVKDVAATIQNGYGVRATVEVPTNATIGSNGVAALVCDAISLAGTHTGKAACISIPNPLAGTWDFLFSFGSAPMTFDTSTITSDLTPTGYKGIPILIGSTTYYIPIATAWA